MCSRGQGESQLRSPEGITFHPERNVLYVADTGNDRIQILDKDGSYLNIIGPIGKRTKNTVKVHRTRPGPSHLNQPTDVAVTTARVVVADSGSHKIKASFFPTSTFYFLHKSPQKKGHFYLEKSLFLTCKFLTEFI